MAARRVVTEVPAWKRALQRWAYYKSYFPQLGLMRDDCLYETSDVKEAIRRLPGEIYDARQFRISRAMYLSNRKEILPKDEWTKMEEDVRYLTPIVKEVEKERQERQEWDKK
ncbi:cytochrome b-c1 complex subunit 7-like [Babylonia areolata]|uniref:cytochrome b-c1 complex subunit 7-like n=1 Tax=Babylonia areolata TaxID=304850 RepID=UPI003FD5B614